MHLWNADTKFTGTLEKTGFNALIGYGFPGDGVPTGILAVQQGKVIRSGLYQGEALDWDLRADPESWKDWLENGLGMERFGFVIARGKLKFKQGDFRSMLKNPSLGGAFLRSFELMGQVGTEW